MSDKQNRQGGKGNKPPAAPERLGGNWLSLELENQSAVARIHLIVSELQGKEQFVSCLAEALLFENFLWPALTSWREFLKRKRGVPGFWDEDLLKAPPKCPYPLKLRLLADGFSDKARHVLATGCGVLTKEGLAAICGLSEVQLDAVIEELEGAGVVFAPADINEVLATLSIDELRLLQREAKLPPARTKLELCSLLRAGLQENQLLDLLPGTYSCIEGIESETWEWAGYCNSVARLYEHTLNAEIYGERERVEAIRVRGKTATIAGPGPGLDPPCQKYDDKNVRLTTEAAWIPHYPGCTCCYTDSFSSSDSKPIASFDGSLTLSFPARTRKQATASQTVEAQRVDAGSGSRSGCLWLLVSFLPFLSSK